jgi:asparagine synthase (glutamine-hydrolysing)
MCGISGFFLSSPDKGFSEVHNISKTMSDKILHRGPNDSGVWVNENNQLSLAHRRLSILDLSSAGHQPMESFSKRYIISFNGEIYNHLEVRSKLEKIDPRITWTGSSDTETLLAAIELWGIEKALHELVGMFAIALWDKNDKKLYLVRDRLGEKPLYFGWIGSDFVFGSELKSLKAFKGFSNQVCRYALDQYLRLMYVPSPLSIYEGIYKLEPGCLLTIDSPNARISPTEILALPVSKEGIKIEQWWSLEDVIKSGVDNQITDVNQASCELESRLKDSISSQSLSDVPLGAFLSGGVDSSLTVALMQEKSIKPIDTFTIGFEEKKYDESVYASAVAKHLGTNHTEVIITSKEARDIIPLLPCIYDEPFADSSQIPTYLVSSIAKKQVTVALSGDGADELFGGYNRYTQGPGIWEKLFKTPEVFRKILSHSVSAIPISSWDYLGSSLNHLKIGSQNFSQLGDKAHKVANCLKEMKTLDDMYLNPISEWSQHASLVKGLSNSIGQFNSKFSEQLEFLCDAEHKMMFLDSKTYLPDDILCKVDRASMSVSLEVRAPFLDYRLVDFAWRLPLSMKVQNGQGKYILRQLLYKYVPKDLIERPKMGFGVPLCDWLRGHLREWAEDLLNEQRLEREGYLNSKIVIETWRKHLSGKYDYSARLWAILMFQAWLEEAKTCSGLTNLDRKIAL